MSGTAYKRICSWYLGLDNIATTQWFIKCNCQIKCSTNKCACHHYKIYKYAIENTLIYSNSLPY